jgi:anionic cell wall polymer biosynthesis LytR-Cps2A-Psr (LCP) family protein
MPTAQHTQPRHQAPPPTGRRTWRIVFVVFGLFAVVVMGFAAVTLMNLTSSFDAVERIPEAFPTNEAARPPAATGEAAAAMNFLLLGSDTRGATSSSIANIAGQRSDTIVIVHVPADRKHLTVMSIPRDSWLAIPGHGDAKINAALAYGGVPLAVETVESVIGSRIDHVAVVDFANPIAFDSYHLKGHSFPQGAQHMDGTEALAFVRERYAFEDGDFQRVRNQQLLIRALLSGLMHKSVLANPVTMGAVIQAVQPHVAVDDGLTAGALAALGAELNGLRSEDVAFFTVPTAGTGTSADGQSIVNLDWAALPGVQEAFRADTMETITPEVQEAAG